MQLYCLGMTSFHLTIKNLAYGLRYAVSVKSTLDFGDSILKNSVIYLNTF